MMGAEAAIIKVRLQPGARKQEVLGYSQGVLRVRVTAPPVGGKANTALVDFLARLFKTRSSQVSILRGSRSRDKLLRVEGLSQEKAAQVLERLGDGS